MKFSKSSHDSCPRCHHSNVFIAEVNKGKWWNPTDWSVLTIYFGFPDVEDVEVFEGKILKYSLTYMEIVFDLMGDKEF